MTTPPSPDEVPDNDSVTDATATIVLFPSRPGDDSDPPPGEPDRQTWRILLDCLTPTQRRVLHLRVIDGLSAIDTAAALQISPAAVRLATHRALNRLRQTIAHQLPRPEDDLTSSAERPRVLGAAPPDP